MENNDNTGTARQNQPTRMYGIVVDGGRAFVSKLSRKHGLVLPTQIYLRVATEPWPVSLSPPPEDYCPS